MQFHHLSNIRTRTKIKFQSPNALQPCCLGKRAILKSLKNCSLRGVTPAQRSVQNLILRPLPSLNKASESTDVHTLAMLTQVLLRLLLDFPFVNQSNASLPWMLLINCLQRADSSFENLHPHLASKAVL